LRANRKLKLPLIADLHENYVEGLKHYKFANTFPGKYIISISKWEKKEREWCRKADHLITVIDEAVNRYKNIGIPTEKIHVVANYVNTVEFLSNPVDPAVAQKYQNDFVLMYIGGFDIHRGLETAVRAMPIVLKKYSQAKLVLVGRGRNQGDLKQLAVKLNIYNNVVFESFQPSEKLPSYISASDICLIPHLKTVHTDNTIPHKLFHYMLLEKPVVATNCNPIQRIIEETKCGLIYENKNSYHMADAVIKLYNNQSLRQQMGTNGRKAVLGKYNWEKTSGNLIEMYKMIGEDVKK
jgi:glycosyltransferase involved in cell wall biosynthesis